MSLTTVHGSVQPFSRLPETKDWNVGRGTSMTTAVGTLPELPLEPPADKAGWMYKTQGKGNAFQRRWFLLTDGRMRYYKKKPNAAAVAKAAGKKTAVVASVPGAILMPWSKDVAAVLTNFLPGQQAGNAIADVLFGKVPRLLWPLTTAR